MRRTSYALVDEASDSLRNCFWLRMIPLQFQSRAQRLARGLGSKERRKHGPASSRRHRFPSFCDGSTHSDRIIKLFLSRRCGKAVRIRPVDGVLTCAQGRQLRSHNLRMFSKVPSYIKAWEEVRRWGWAWASIPRAPLLHRLDGVHPDRDRGGSASPCQIVRTGAQSRRLDTGDFNLLSQIWPKPQFLRTLKLIAVPLVGLGENVIRARLSDTASDGDLVLSIF